MGNAQITVKLRVGTDERIMRLRTLHLPADSKKLAGVLAIFPVSLPRTSMLLAGGAKENPGKTFSRKY
jgi:hypothetical protein